MRPILIAGPTASGKSALALMLAAQTGATVVNADALQVYSTWRILTARPDDSELAKAPHALYGHVPFAADYSTGAWLREIRAVLAQTPRVIIVGGTGLNFTALTQGLADIPVTPPDIRAAGDARGAQAMRDDLLREDPATLAKIDIANPMRVQRAWEVLRTTGEGLASWQARTPPPLLPLNAVRPVVLRPETEWLNQRIARRFDLMLEHGALEEARAALPDWTPTRPAAKAIGAPELIAYLRGEISLETARAQAIIASRQYAKRQRTWFRNSMQGWQATPLGPQSRLEPLAAQILAGA